MFVCIGVPCVLVGRVREGQGARCGCHGYSVRATAQDQRKALRNEGN